LVWIVKEVWGIRTTKIVPPVGVDAASAVQDQLAAFAICSRMVWFSSMRALLAAEQPSDTVFITSLERHTLLYPTLMYQITKIARVLGSC